MLHSRLRPSGLILSLVGGLLSSLVAPVPAGAQAPADRAAIESFRDSLQGITDTTALLALEGRLVNEAKANRTDALGHIRVGFVNLRLGDLGLERRYEDAASEFNWATELQPDWPYGWYGLGFAELGIGEPQIALVAGLQNMFGKDHMTKGALAFARAAEVDPTFVRGLVELANTALKQRVNIKLDLAREALRIASTTVAGRNPDVLLWRGRVERQVGSVDTAVMSFQRYLGAGNINRSLGLIELARAQFVAGARTGSEAYYQGAALDDSIGIAEYRKDLLYIAPDSTMAQFDLVSGADRAAFLGKFWTARDRLDLRGDHERLTEHYRRVHYAQRNFSLVSTKRHYDIAERYRSNSTEFDDRGLIYIRHGEPTERATLGIPNIELNETWKYARIDGNLVFHFVAREDVQDYKLIESLYDVLGYANAVRFQAGDSLGGLEVTRLLESRERIDPIYSRLQGVGRAGRIMMTGEERRMGQKSIAQGTTSDSYQLRFAQNLRARTDVMAVGRSADGNLLQVTWAVPGATLKPVPNPAGFVYPVRLRVSVLDQQGNVVAALDTIKMFLSQVQIPQGENLVDRMSLAVPAGTLSYRIAVDQTEQAGIVMPTSTIDVGSFDGASFTVSSVVLGARHANLRWVREAGDTVFFNPTGVYRQNADMELYYEVYGLPAGTPYDVELRVGRPQGGRAAIALKYEEKSQGTVTRVNRAIKLERVRQGDYTLTLIITTADGKRAERRAAFQVSKEKE